MEMVAEIMGRLRVKVDERFLAESKYHDRISGKLELA
jgi:hypothetical protein